MSSAVVLDSKFSKKEELSLPESFKEINSHNLYLYVKSYQAALRANSASAKTRSEVSGGGKKPWMQKGLGRARAGSVNSPIFTGGGKAHGPSNNRNYNLKVNKKQKKLAFKYAVEEKAANSSLYVVESLKVESGKTKDAAKIVKGLGHKDLLFVVENYEESTFLAFRNLKNCFLVEKSELNPYVVAAFDAVVVEKTVFEEITKEG